MPLVANAVPVLTNIAAPETNFKRFFASQARAAEIVAPVAAIQGELWANLDLTLAAFADVARPFLQETISKGPKGLQTAIETFPQIRPFFRETQKFFTQAPARRRGAQRSRRRRSRTRSSTARPCCASPSAFNRQLEAFLRDLQKFAQDPIVPIGFQDLVDTVQALDPTIS